MPMIIHYSLIRNFIWGVECKQIYEVCHQDLQEFILFVIDTPTIN